MAKYVLKRMGQSVIVLFLASLLTFILINIAPGDPVLNMLDKRADPMTIERVRHELGLDVPPAQQFVNFLKGAIAGDLGNSYFQKQPVTRIVGKAFQSTARIGAGALILSTLIGLVVGIVAAVWRNKWADHLLMFIAMLGISAPIFWVAVILQIIFGLKLELFPISGQEESGWLVMPVVCLGTHYGASSARLVRTNMIEVLNQDYVRTARSKGLSEATVVLKHVLKNASISVITLVGMQLRSLISGAMVIETVFAIRGIGKVSYNAILTRDIPLVQGCVIYTAAVYIIINLLVDLLYGTLDPRVRLS